MTLGTATLTVGGDNTSPAAFAGVISGTGALTKIGAGTLALSGANAYTGLTTVSAGTLTEGVANALSTGAVTVNGGTFAMGAFNDTVGAVTLSSGSITGTSGVLTGASYDMQSGTVSAILGGTSIGLTKTTAGTVTLSGVNTYSGTTTISEGTLKLGGTAALGATSGTSVATGTTLDLNGYTLGTAIPLTLNGTGVGAVGALTNSSATAASYSGAITLGSDSSIGVGSGKTLVASGAINAAFALDVLGGGNITLGGAIGNSTPLSSLTGEAGTALNITGGAVSTSGAQAYNGMTSFGTAVTLNASTLAATGAISAGTFTLGSGVWSQINATLPTFTATDFRIAGGTFIRATGGNGTSGTPYLLADIYGVQGMGRSLGLSYALANDVEASGTVSWNSGAGFSPIGSSSSFTGSFNGLGHTINGLIINGATWVGLFSKTSSSAVITNIGLVGGSPDA